MNTLHRRRLVRMLVCVALLICVGGCGFTRVRATELNMAASAMPQDRLLDIGVAVCKVPKLNASKTKKQGTSTVIRDAESVFVPCHLKNTLQKSGYWGTVQVIPRDADNVDIKITSELVESTGERMRIKIKAVDAAGRVWLTANYEGFTKAKHYENSIRGEHDPLQDLYNHIANKLSTHLALVPPEEIRDTRMISKLKFAADFAPDAYRDHIIADKKGRITITHMPADSDPQMRRIEQIRMRDLMFINTLNRHYDLFYNSMWDPYHTWREHSRTAIEARRKAEAEATAKIVGAIFLVVVSAAAGVNNNSAGIMAAGAAGATALAISASKDAERAEQYSAELQEMASSFGMEMGPTYHTLEGKTYELTGTADEQYTQWRTLLRDIYVEETGFPLAHD